MSTDTVHVNHHESHIAYGTGGHTHHRAVLSDGRVRQSFWRCERGTAPLRACPDEPDPFARLLVKVAEAASRPPARAGIVPSRPRCRYGHAAEHQSWNSQGHAICVECRRLASVKARLRRRATAIVAAALAA